MPSIQELLNQARRELLDLGLRNTLLNYRLTKGRGVEVVGHTAEEVFRRLVIEAEEFVFAPARSGDTKERLPKLALQTSHDERSLQSRLLGSYHAARTHLEERGVNILFMAVGMLHWYEDDNSHRELKAPLLLVPVELTRANAQERFKLRYSDEDVEGNVSLSAKLAEFTIDYPALPEIEDLDLRRYFDAIEAQTAPRKRWRVERDEIALGFFSFSKFLMFKDLDAGKWSTPENPDGGALLAAMLRDGFKDGGPSYSEDAYLDKAVAPNLLRQVVDADSSQALAMLDVASGRNLVIQGPPGTGKSQTITNLIADAIGARKRVLFVAEKSTALEVVKRRLDKVNLGDACLELHSHSANKKAVLAELKRTLTLGRPSSGVGKWSLDHFKETRDQLNAYCLAVNTPINASGWTPHQVMGEILKASHASNGVSLPSMAEVLKDGTEAHREVIGWNRTTLAVKEGIVQRLQNHLVRMGVPAEHPFRHSRLDAVLPSDEAAIRAGLGTAIDAQRTLLGCVRELAQFMGINARESRHDAEVLTRAARRALTAPHLRGLDLRTGEWAEKRDEIAQVLDQGDRYASMHSKFDPILLPEAWDQDLLQTRQVLNTTGREWWRWFSGEYRRSRQRVAGLCQADHPKDVQTQLSIIDAIMEAARARKSILESDALMARLFGVQWQAVRSDWQVLRRLTEWVVDLYRELGDGRLPSGIVDFLMGTPSLDALKTKVTAVEQALPVYDKTMPGLLDTLAYEDSARTQLASFDLPEQLQMFELMLDRADTLQSMVSLNNLRQLLEEARLGWVLEVAWRWPEASQFLIPFFRQNALEPLLRWAYQERPALRAASGASQGELQETFKTLDVASLKATQLELAKTHHRRLPMASGLGQMGILSREFEKRGRHLPIRKLIEQAGDAIQKIKPVMMMSPMSVAAFIPPRTVDFDLVIFDEASQVKPVDAFGAIMRGSQLVVVGDSKQLPPTSFFDSMVAGDDADEDEEDTNVAADMESILGLAKARGVSERMLRWHYRSRHHSLIELSNSQFYEHRLVVFPSPQPTSRKLGLHFHHLPKTAYDRGKTRTNPLEAQLVAKAVMAHAKSNPNLTLGVAAFSLAQADAVLEELERLRRLDPSVENFFSAHPHEPFFVKNLESVQGDERDVIFISIGYGRTADGYPVMNFGAVNREGGERRLNVLITRARLSCEVFSNITDDDIDLSRSQKKGVVALKAFLRYARTGIADVPTQGATEEDSPFEAEVAAALRAAGHDVVPQVGSAGFRIDLGVRDPDKPGRYILGIECDGATYHSSRSARDRDRLRQQVLEGLTWRIHRIWSTDWFKDPQGELRRAIAAIEQARMASTSVASEKPEQTPEEAHAPMAREEPSAEPVGALRATPYQTASLQLSLRGKELHEVYASPYADWITRVVDIEGPVHVDEVLRRIAEAAGVQRVGSRIEGAFERGLSEAVRRNSVQRRGRFLWPMRERESIVRDRSTLDSRSRKLEYVAPEEIGEAILRVVEASVGINAEFIASSTCKLLGFARTSVEMASLVEGRLDDLVSTRRISIEGGHVTIQSAPAPAGAKVTVS
jgi:hypothetical protein